MPGWIAAKLVSELSNGKDKLRFLPHNFELYERMSSCVKKILLEYDPWLKSYSMDEAYLELQPYLNLRIGRGWDHDRVTKALKLEFQRHRQQSWEDNVEHKGTTAILKPADVLHEMRAKVFEKTGLTCSAGMATNHMLAKIASDVNKPNGQLFVEPYLDNILSFIRPLPIRKIPGIGRVLEQTLNAFHISTVADLYQNRAILPIIFKDGATSDFLLRASIGMSSSDSATSASVAKQTNCKKIEDYCCLKEKASPTACKPPIIKSFQNINMRKGISRERTFSSGRSWLELVDILEGITAILMDDMIKEEFKARTITVKVKLHTFEVMSKSKSLPQGIFFSNSTASMFPIALDLLNDTRRVKNECIGDSRIFNCRLLGVRFSNLERMKERAAASSRETFQQLKLESFMSHTTNSMTVMPQHLLERQSCIVVQTDTENTNDTADPDLCVEHKEDRSEIKRFHACSITDFFTARKGVSSGENDSLCCCPVCNKALPSLKNEEVNRHIDMCLNSMAVRQVLKEECGKKEGIHLSRKHLVTDFFS
jgi:DNA polymerase kappa